MRTGRALRDAVAPGAWKRRARSWPGYRRCRDLWRALTWSRHAFQPYGDTLENRHPQVFELCRRLLDDGPDRHLLSFGCSTGEEVFTLRRYFPTARITGIDVHALRIRLCRWRWWRRGRDPGIAFILGHQAPACGNAYDAIFCLSVFRHGDLQNGSVPARPAPRCDHLIRFADYERTVAGLARSLRPGGLLVLWHGNFRFQDTRVAAGFETVAVLGGTHPAAATPIYGPDDRLMPGAVDDRTIFRRL